MNRYEIQKIGHQLVIFSGDKPVLTPGGRMFGTASQDVADLLYQDTGLPGSPMHATIRGILGDIMTSERPTAPSTGHRECLSIPRLVLESSRRLATVVGHGPSGKSRLRSECGNTHCGGRYEAS
jgi:hypothetical protein